MRHGLVRIIFAAVILATSALPQPVFRVPVRVVAVPVVAQNPGGGFVRNLPAAEFRVFDNDRPQRFQLDYIDQPIAVAVVVQTNDAGRAWLPHVRRATSLVETLVVGANGQASVTGFGSSVIPLQSWTGRTELLDAAFAGLKPTLDDKSRSLDAVSEAAGQLAALPASFRRVILLVAQPGDVGSAAKLPDVLRRIEVNNIIVYSLAMPHIGKEIARKTISIGSPRGKFGGNDTGIMGAVELSKLVPELYRDADAAAARDAVSILTAETGGSRANFRRLRDYESGLSAIAEELHTEYVLTYTPDSAEPGYHRIRVELARSGLTLRARPGYYNPE